jgi:hypothetical protein
VLDDVLGDLPGEVLDVLLGVLLGEADDGAEPEPSGALVLVDGESEESPVAAAGVSFEEPVARLSLR